MKKGDRVTWTNADGIVGHGELVTDPDENDHVLVAIDNAKNMERITIYCATTWLKPE